VRENLEGYYGHHKRTKTEALDKLQRILGIISHSELIEVSPKSHKN